MLQNKVKQIREQKGITQVELCKKANISRATLCKIESGMVSSIKTSTAASIANALGTPANEIFYL